MAEVNGFDGAAVSQAQVDSSPALQEKLDKVKASLQDFQDTFQQNFVKSVLGDKDDGDSKDGTGGWLQAIAKSMGEVLGAKAAHMVQLSADISGLNEQTTAGGGGGTGGVAGGDGGTTGNSVQTDRDKSLAMEMNLKMTEFQATSQEYSILSNAFSTAIKGLGESMSSMAKK